jgi:hypothetical protein
MRKLPLAASVELLQAAVKTDWGVIGMSQDYVELRGSGAFELRKLDNILAELTRPALAPDSMTPATRAALLQLGICVVGDVSKREIVERLWGRKRSLLRQMRSTNSWGPYQPVA